MEKCMDCDLYATCPVTASEPCFYYGDKLLGDNMKAEDLIKLIEKENNKELIEYMEEEYPNYAD